MDAQIWGEIRRLKAVEGLAERQIADRLLISRGKVRRALAGLPTQREPREVLSKLDRFKPAIIEILKDYPDLSGVRIFEKLKTLGYGGGTTILREYLTNLRGLHREAFVRYETAPGEEAQVDWGYFGTLPFGDNYRKISFFVMVLSYSRKLYVEFTASQSLDVFLQCHLNAFKYFGGVPKTILYDNLKSVVISRYVNHIQYNQKFLEFAGYYLFTPKACNVRRANEKGKVESGVGFVEKNFLAGRDFRDLFDLETQERSWLEQANQRVHGTTKEIPDERFQREKEFLLPLQPHDYDTTFPLQVRAYHDCRLRFDGNYYSVPAKYILLPLIMRAGKYELKIFHQTILIATHQRSYGNNEKIDDPKHFADLLKIKKAARDSKLRERFLALAPCCAQYFEGLLRLEKDLKSEILQIMQLADTYGNYEIIPALEKALEYKAFGVTYLKNIIAQNRAKRQEKTIQPLKLSKYPDLENLEVEPKSLDYYDQLIKEEENQGKKGENNHA
ncbi:IS21 family transposase [Candidatus Saganbacteria bacterium]|nr:IS21 family transposase [Candidatus Saganbacteria bacterium]